MNLRTIPQRRRSSSVIVVGMAAVTAVVTSVLSMSTGFLESVGKTGSPGRAIVLSAGAADVNSSALSRDAIGTIEDGVGVRKTLDGRPIASADYFGRLLLTKKSDGRYAQVPLHGVGPQTIALLPQIKLVSGRMFRPSVHEVIVGQLVQSQVRKLQIGNRILLPQSEWTVVGTFTSDGDEHESEILGDADTIMSAYRKNTFNSVTAALESPDAFDRFKQELTTNPTLSVEVIRENEYFAKLTKPLDDFLTLIAVTVGGLMGLGAVFGAVNTMYSAISARLRQIATLRAIGFSAAPVVISVLAEALLLSLIGAAIGAGFSWLLFNGSVTVSGSSIFRLAVTPGLIGLGIGWGAAAGLVGGLFPALRAARVPVATALRAM
jgi:putative ABC transport system permease protein